MVQSKDRLQSCICRPELRFLNSLSSPTISGITRSRYVNFGHSEKQPGDRIEDAADTVPMIDKPFLASKEGTCEKLVPNIPRKK